MKYTIKFVGVGGAFAPISKGNSNMIVESNGKKLLIDCGTTAPYILKDEWDIQPKDIDALYVSHLHADHIGGIEWLAFMTYFMKTGKPKLYCEKDLMEELWESSLKGGMESLEGSIASLTTYFECIPFVANQTFIWEGILFTPVQTIHIVSGYKFKHSFGLLLRNPDNNEKIGNRLLPINDVFITTDTQFSPSQLQCCYNHANLILHDCETLPYRSGVHAHYDDLNTLSPEFKNKMWLYHYANERETVVEDGFAGFVKKGQVFEIES